MQTASEKKTLNGKIQIEKIHQILQYFPSSVAGYLKSDTTSLVRNNLKMIANS